MGRSVHEPCSEYVFSPASPCVLVYLQLQMTSDCSVVFEELSSKRKEKDNNYNNEVGGREKEMAISTFSPVGSLSSNSLRMRVCVDSTGIVT